MVTPVNLNADCKLAGVSLKLPVDSSQYVSKITIPLYSLLLITCREFLSVC